MRLPIHIIGMLQKKTGSDLRLPSDCERLSLDIESQTGHHLGATTLKRLLGFTPDERTPHATTLDIIAKFLGFSHWEALIANELANCSNFDRPKKMARSADLFIGDEVYIAYEPNRRVTFKYLGDDWFEVVERENNKLMVGDRLRITIFVLGRAFFASEVIRDGKNLGTYSAAISTGIRTFYVVRNGSDGNLDFSFLYEGKINRK